MGQKKVGSVSRIYPEVVRNYGAGAVREAPTLIGWVLRMVRRPHLWGVVAIFVVCIIFHYPEQIVLSPFFSSIGLTRHAMDRILFLLPISYTGVVFGLKAGLASVAIALSIMLPRVFLISLHPLDALLETGAVIVVGVLVNVWLDRSRRKR
jgi:two-component system sensor histidine kinase DegS